MYRMLDLEYIPLTLWHTKLMFYWEFEDVSKFPGIVLIAICSQVQSERSSDHVFVSKYVPQTLCCTGYDFLVAFDLYGS